MVNILLLKIKRRSTVFPFQKGDSVLKISLLFILLNCFQVNAFAHITEAEFTNDCNDSSITSNEIELLKETDAYTFCNNNSPLSITGINGFDLALIIDYYTPNYTDNDNNGVISPGDDVTFDITVFNQGTIDAYDVNLVAYIMDGTTLNDPAWSISDNGDLARLIDPISDITTIESDTTLSITLTIDTGFLGNQITAIAEIAYATDTDGSGINTTDIDSQADMIEQDMVGGNSVTDNSNGDEDDHDLGGVAIVQPFDLALVNTLSPTTPGPFVPGSTVTFDMTISNQAGDHAYDVQLVNYIPTGLTLADPNWTVVGSIAVLQNEIPFIGATENVVVSITYTIDNSFQETTITNWAEISFATDTDGSLINVTDIDSQADNINFNQIGETNDLSDDNVNNENGNTGGDEDDHDPVQIEVVQTFDLALFQNVTSYTDNDGDGFISGGDDVLFTMTVYNQGTLDATNVVVTNYVPTDMIFIGADNSDFIEIAGIVQSTIPNLPITTSENLSITLRVAPTFTGQEIINWAEISNDNSIVADDDSTPDNINFNEVGETNDLFSDDIINENGKMGDDEDDHDPARILIGEVFDLALIIIYTFPDFADNDGDGLLTPGDEVTFDMQVKNQGTIDAFDIEVTNYLPAGTTIYDPAWDDSDGDGIANLITPISDLTVAEGDTTISITIRINDNFQGDEIIDLAEVSFATSVNNSGINTTDFDSNADSVNDDVIGGDNIVNNFNGDEDDHDFVLIPVVADPITQDFDLAINLVLDSGNSGPFFPDSLIQFNITVFNQGDLDAYDVQIRDRLATGLTLSDNNWTITGANAELVNPIPYIAAGSSETVGITFLIDDNPPGTIIENWAEIAFATATDNSTMNEDDIDSTPGDGSISQDDDDNIAISLSAHKFDLALSQSYSSYVDNNGDNEINPGDDVIFDITVYNQGTLDASNIEVTNYIPSDMIFNTGDNLDFTNQGADAKTTIPNISSGSSETVSITLQINPSFQGAEIINWAEVSNEHPIYSDEDSTPDAINFNQTGETNDLTDDDVISQNGLTGGDEDDHDTAIVTISASLDQTLSITCTPINCNSSNIEIDALITWIGISNDITVEFMGQSQTLAVSSGTTSPQTVTFVVPADGTVNNLVSSNGIVTETTAVTLTECACANPPIARDDIAFTEMNTPIVIDVQANDTDSTNTGLTTLVLTQPSNGSALLVGNNILYSPNIGFYGTEVFTYRVTNQNGLTDDAEVTVIVSECGGSEMIDAFTTGSPLHELTTVGTLSSTDNGVGILGGQRIVNTYNYQADAGFKVYTEGEATTGLFQYNETGAVRGGFLLTYENFGTHDLTSAGTKGSIDIALKSNHNSQLQLRVYNSATDYATYTLPINSSVNLELYKILFTDFVPVSAGVDFASITKIEIEFDSRNFNGNQNLELYTISTGCSTNACDPNPLATPFADCDGDGVVNGQEQQDGTDHTNPCDYDPSSQDFSIVTAIWNALDCDGDGVVNAQEILDGTNPQKSCDYNPASVTVAQSSEWNLQDCDGDGVLNEQEISDSTDPLDFCDLEQSSITVPSSTQWNDQDCDGDGVSNSIELTDGTDLTNPCDYNPNNQNLSNVTVSWNALDCDGDGVTNTQEVLDNTNPLNPCDYNPTNQNLSNVTVVWNGLDCDGDGVTNGQEILDNTDPQAPCDFDPNSSTLATSTVWNALDCDGDGVSNAVEQTDGTNLVAPCSYNPTNQDLNNVTVAWNGLDCDGDGVTNGQEILDNTDPQAPCDFEPNSITLATSTAWNALDCDGDGVINGQEILDATDPLDPCDFELTSITVTPSDEWNLLDCDDDGTTNEDDPEPNNPCFPNSPTLAATFSYSINADCTSGDLTLNASLTPALGAIVSIDWSGPNNFSASIESPIIANATMAANGEYIVVIADDNGCSASDTIEVQTIVESEDQPQITGANSICEGEQIVLSIPQYQGSTVLYNWTYPGDGTNITGLGTNEIIINSASTSDSGNYSVEVTTENNCILSVNPYAVAVHEGLVISAYSDVGECITLGADINLNAVIAGGPGTYDILWTGPQGFTSTNLSPQVLNISENNLGEYALIITDLNGCTSSATTVVNAGIAPTTPALTVIENNLCVNEILELQTNTYTGSTVSYHWVLEGVLDTTYETNNPSLFIPDLNSLDEGIYSVYVTVDGCPSSISAGQFVAVNTQAEIAVVAPDIVFCEGSEIVLTTTTIADNYYWTGPNGFTSNEQNPPAILNATALEAGEYNLIISNNGCTSDAATVMATFEELPEAPILIMQNSICEGEDIVLTVVGGNANSYQWISPSNSPNGDFGDLNDPNNVIWTTSATTTISQATHPQFYEGGTWTVQALSQNTCISELSVSQSLVINTVPETPIATNNGSVCNNEIVQLYASSVPNAEYKWYDNDPYASPSAAVLISTDQNPFFANLPAGLNAFYLTVNVNGCEPTLAAMTEVEVSASTVVLNAENTGPYCIGDVIQLEGPSIPGATYFWTGPNNFTSYLEDPIIEDADLTNEGVYTLIVEDPMAICPSLPATTDVIVSTPPETPVASFEGPICEGDPIYLYASDVPSGTVVVYSWTGPNGFISDEQNPVIPEAGSLEAGNYNLLVFVDGCASLVSAPINVVIDSLPATPVAFNNTTPTDPVCEGGVIELSTDFIFGATYQWYGPGDFESELYNPIITDVDSIHHGEYMVYVTIDGCTSLAGLTAAYVQLAPEMPVAINDGPICIGENLTLSVANYNASASYEWFYEPTNTFVGSGPATTMLDVTETSTYYVVSTLNGCHSTSNVEGTYAETVVQVDTPSPDVAYAGDDIIHCDDFVSIEAYPVTVWNGQWSMMDEDTQVEILNPNEEATAANELEVGENILLWSIQSGACGITSQDTLVVTYLVGPETQDDAYSAVINTSVNENMIRNDLLNTDSFSIVLVEDVSNGSLEVNDDGTFVYTPNQGFVGVEEFTYLLCNEHCLDQCSESVVRMSIGADANCVAPDIITPNNDGLNDSFIVPCLSNYEGSNLCVYNRWGDEIFHSEDYKNDWEGTYKGDDLPVGTYFYVLKVNDGSDSIMKGYIFIQR